MCPSSLEIDIGSSFFLHFWQGDSRKYQISRGLLSPCQENRTKRQQKLSSAGCKVVAPNAGFLLASILSYSRFRPIECFYSQSVSVNILLIPEFCPGGQRQRLTLNKSTLLVLNDSKKTSKPIEIPHLVPGSCIQQNSLFVAA